MANRQNITALRLGGWIALGCIYGRAIRRGFRGGRRRRLRGSGVGVAEVAEVGEADEDAGCFVDEGERFFVGEPLSLAAAQTFGLGVDIEQFVPQSSGLASAMPMGCWLRKRT